MSVQINMPQGNNIEQSQTDERRFTRLGWLVIGIGLAGFFLWASLAPLDKGVASPGSVTVSGNRKTIQSPAGGIVRNIAVKEGEKVKAGEVLVQMSQVQAQAQVDSLQDQYYTTLATAGRLLAERDNLSEIRFSPVFDTLKDSPRVAEIIALQVQLFSSRQQALRSEIDGFRQSSDGIRFQLKGLQDSRINKQIQLSSIREQMSSMKQLAAEGYLPRNRYLEAQRQFAEINSSIDETIGRIGQLQKQLLESQQRIEQRYADYQREVRTQLAQTQMDANDFKNKLDMAKYDLGNTSIISPVDGTVVGLTIFTQGGVVGAGEHLMDIVPSEASLIVDSRLKVEMIDKVYKGLPVELMFTAFNQNKTPKIPGTVTLVSADRLVDKGTGEPFYQMQVTVTPEGIKMLQGADIKPGMPVEVFVKTGSRSLLSYLFKPILDRARTSLTEE
ncbi:HlyD family type I secretion periplasmic adaptor subunit [Klebsiella aerogenes]|jgi:protease secretion system membrane fusion protein|uniref:HlyD family type I secretion periplasmic adaptor subunit n=1 Tax=Klebsiella TaxID=570 RepID=UPI0005EDF9BA|nr:HlyD family type I secretion periplasmic adaptor subunit [Klebsiella aerogenes]EIV5803014.1 HlyD family type I secretion periplasmic adaptor subunit [Klebsiella aerogenes]EJL5446978.1 HlyD family type I secretion periplasmic adaptor subunit [Klebsiella aerogenes]EKY1835501.1 HlyD family type I secretion periplasmic adaptor subunit [Klebsiella aerogenes]EKZ3167700.1 HlyD family type I secretion periplasmic adaptor subunit [Klebsiella aerogenes]EKZ6401742.1 HlyD family type I secretion peripl